MALAALLIAGGAPVESPAAPAIGLAGAGVRPDGVSLTVRIRRLRNDHGRVAVALYQTEASFPKADQALAGRLAKIEKGTAAVTFSGVLPGVYAVAVLHDENANSKMDFNFLGMPLEGYGFSNDAAAMFGPPSFAAASFRLPPRPSFIVVNIRYLL